MKHNASKGMREMECRANKGTSEKTNRMDHGTCSTLVEQYDTRMQGRQTEEGKDKICTLERTTEWKMC